MKALTARQRAQLKSLAHPLKALLHVGKEGVTPALVQSIEDALRTRELVKVKVLESAPAEARDVGAHIVAEIADSHLVQVIGRTVVLYRPHPDAPVIRLNG